MCKNGALFSPTTINQSIIDEENDPSTFDPPRWSMADGKTPTDRREVDGHRSRNPLKCSTSQSIPKDHVQIYRNNAKLFRRDSVYLCNNQCNLLSKQRWKQRQWYRHRCSGSKRNHVSNFVLQRQCVIKSISAFAGRFFFRTKQMYIVSKTY